VPVQRLVVSALYPGEYHPLHIQELESRSYFEPLREKKLPVSKIEEESEKAFVFSSINSN
jgi:hypothetical protein